MPDVHHYVASRGVLGVRTNVPGFKWSFGLNMPEGTEAEFEACRVRLRATVTASDEEFGERAQDGKYHYFSGTHGVDDIDYERGFFFGSRLRLAARGLLSPEPHLLVNRHYYRWVSHRFMNLHSTGYILTDLAGLLLLRQGLSPLHCSAFRVGEATVVVLAAPNTGKTLATMTACMDHGAEFIAEDLAITDGQTIHSVPWTSTFRYYSKVDQRLSSRLVARATKLLPVLELVSLSKIQPVDAYVDARRMVDHAPITHVIVLERGPEGIVDLPREELYRRALNLNRYEFNYHRAPLVTAAEYFSPGLEIDAAMAKEREVLRRMTSAASCGWVVSSPDPTRYAALLVERLRRG